MLISSVSSGAEQPASKARMKNVVSRAVDVAKAWRDAGRTTSRYAMSERTVWLPRGATTPFNVPLDFTGLLSVSFLQVNSPAETPNCVNCTTAAVPQPNLAVTFPTGVLSRGGVGTTHMSFQSQKASGNCEVGFVWFDVGLNAVFQGALSDPFDCSAAPGSISVRVFSFFNFSVPAGLPPGNKVLVGVLLHDDGTVRTDFEQFVVQ
jgi:hypothetical protein